MFGPSLKSVPGCLVSIVPMLIGVPVAFTPGFVPHFDVSTEPLALLALEVLAVLLLPPPDALLLELELLLPHPASANKPSTVMSARPRRTRTEWWYILTLSSPQ
jgi:hypothetical protein